MDTDKIKIYGARVRSDSMGKVAEIEAAERAKMKDKCMRIVDHGINCFVNRQVCLPVMKPHSSRVSEYWAWRC